ncbi:L,D-transpeptidase [Actinophytocola algeriensis]|uniref:Lipoprotein-anchoring transpeptidase ErfK/SrfK n=1 Tax=Actinophytocola algeriensis TaxID=1768010 RepID=A0A7W7VIQ2_9PSEU|nr:Ig-like domain-containing protein [Actinophytocola algeriensis]MBB4911802.1 lipoprotein-anchoring transpeptidase ErfK/SrfK [Actinophytocola algeriensis]MBE1477706.1 lipoprotein-anchoring transpeptidase ErfK/SrfK [Actinophytocola algeriensis]
MRSGRRLLGTVATLVAAIALLASCTSDDGGGSGGPFEKEKKAPAAKLAFAPEIGAVDVAPTTPVKITVTDGELTEATVTNPEGAPVTGQLAPDKKSWTSGEVLGYAKAYTYTVKAENADGRVTEKTGTFNTLAPAATPRATINPGDNATVGVGMPVSVKFPEGPPEDKAAVEKALTVETSQPVEGSWAWISDSQVDWRPKEYWPANTQVTVNAKLYGVAYGGGAYGKADLSTQFTIGRNQVVKINTPDHVMNVYRDGQLFASYPSSNGDDNDPNLNTPNGTVIVMAKEEVGDFSNPRYGYTNVMKKWAVRISNHGEFIHENNDNAANIGKKNSSHGCVNLLEADAKAYFDSALIGDPVEITGSKADFPTTSDVFDWLLSWEQWQSMSALN